MRFIFEYTKNTKYEKDMVNLQLNIFLRNSELNFNNPNYKFFLNIINKFLKSKFLTNNNKYSLLYIKKKIKNNNMKKS